MRDIAGPVIGNMLRPGELDLVVLSWGGAVPLPDGSPSLPTELTLELVCAGEQFSLPLWTVGQDEFDVPASRDRFRSALQDFMAESRFGWGQQR